MTNPPRVIHVVQGEQAVSDRSDTVITTVLGSCVSACILDLARGIGGMNHFLLPDAGPGRGDNRHAAAAMERLVNALLKAGAARGNLQAKLFGGAKMLRGLPDIGARNAEAAKLYLRQEGIMLAGADLCGEQARRIRFWPTTGRVQLLLLGRTEQPREAPSAPIGGDVELF